MPSDRIQSEGMAARLGEVVFWGCSVLAALIVVLGLYFFSDVFSSGLPKLAELGECAAFIAVPAGLVFLLGRAALYVLAAR